MLRDYIKDILDTDDPNKVTMTKICKRIQVKLTEGYNETR